MAKYLDIENWKRKQHFYFFKSYDNPFFNLCANVAVTHLVEYTKKARVPFSNAILYLSLKAANNIEEFRYRLRGDRVIIHDTIHAGNTILSEDKVFHFYYFDYCENFVDFVENIAKAKDKLNEAQFDAQDERDDLIHYSIIPWVSFTGLSHASKKDANNSTPKIAFGKYFTESGIVKLPTSIEVHHSLMDGFHVSQFFLLLQKYLDSPITYLENSIKK